MIKLTKCSCNLLMAKLKVSFSVSFFFFKCLEKQFILPAFEVVWHMAAGHELSPKELIDGEEKTFREGKVQFSTSLSCLKEM